MWPASRIRTYTGGNVVEPADLDMLQDGVIALSVGQRLATWNFDEITQITGGTLVAASPLTADLNRRDMTGAPMTLWKALTGLPYRASIQMIRVLCVSGLGSVPEIALQHQAPQFTGGMPTGMAVGDLGLSPGALTAAGGYYWIDFGDGTTDLGFVGDDGGNNIGAGYPQLKIERDGAHVGVVPLLAAFALWKPAPLL